AKPQALGDRTFRKTSAVLDPAKSFLFNSRDKSAIADERSRHVTVVCVQPKNVHRCFDRRPMSADSRAEQARPLRCSSQMLGPSKLGPYAALSRCSACVNRR